jgi:hypothetical protein
MNVVNFNERPCERFRRYADAYLDNELPVGNQDLIQHLSSCTDCSRILEGRAQVKRIVKGAVKREEAPPDLAVALHERLHRKESRFFLTDTARLMMATAAVGLLLAVSGLFTLTRVGLLQFGADEGVLSGLSSKVQSVLRVGLIDHVHCTILFQQWKRFISFEDMKARTGGSALGPEFINLVPAVQAKLGPNLKIIQGHRCTADQRQYVHIIMQGEGDKLFSIVITRKRGESFTQAQAVAVMTASGIPIYRGRQGSLEIAGFESERYLAYVVSNSDRRDNLQIASVLAPVVYEHLRKLDL